MDDFDPRIMEPYVPPGSTPIAYAHKCIVNAFYDVRPDDHEPVPFVGEGSKPRDYEFNLAVYAGHIVPDDECISEVSWMYLRHELIAGFVRSFVIDKEGKASDVDPKFWATDFAGMVLSSGHMPDLNGENPTGAVVVPQNDVSKVFHKYLVLYITRFKVPFRFTDEQVKLWLDDLNQFVPEEGDGIARPPSVRLLAGGRPPVYDPQKFLTCALTVMSESKPPHSKADLGRRAADAYEQAGGRGGRPSNAWVKGKVALLWRELGKDNNPSEVSDL